MNKLSPLVVLVLWVAQIAAHPMPSTLIDLSVRQQQLFFDIKVPAFDIESAVFKEPKVALNAGQVHDSLIHYFNRHLKISGMDGTVWQMSVQGIDTIALNDKLVGPYNELIIRVIANVPSGADTRSFLLFYDAVLHQVVTHQALLSVKQDWENGIACAENAPVLTVIQVDPATGTVLPVAVHLEKGNTWKGFRAMLALGGRHIAEGRDHLMFLLLLLVVAPLMVSGKKWGGFGGRKFALIRLLKIVTAFTIGHSLTLILCSLVDTGFSSRWVEVTIAFSILVSAVHVLTPLFFKKEIWVACGFGLIHGMAFSDTLRQLHLDNAQLLWSLLGFNLGIELVQLVIVAVTMPLILWFSRKASYQWIRTGAGVIGVFAAIYWIWERIG